MVEEDQRNSLNFVVQRETLVVEVVEIQEVGDLVDVERRVHDQVQLVGVHQQRRAVRDSEPSANLKDSLRF